MEFELTLPSALPDALTLHFQPKKQLFVHPSEHSQLKTLTTSSARLAMKYVVTTEKIRIASNTPRIIASASVSQKSGGYGGREHERD